MAAAYLARHLPKHKYAVTVVDTGECARASWCSVAHYDLRRFNKAIGLSELDFIKTTQATFSLGDHYVGFGGDNGDFYAVYADYGISLGGAAFYHAMAHLGRLPSLQAIENYCLPAKAARQGKFLPPDTKGRPVLSDYSYGYHFNAEAYAAQLLALSEKFGVNIVKASLVSFDTAGNHIKSLTLDNGQTLQADLFIDASGPDARIACQQSTRKSQMWSGWGFAKSYNSETKTPHGSLPIATKIEATNSGWTVHAPLQNTTHKLVFSTATDCDATISSGRQEQLWVGNVVTLGTAAATIEPRFGATLRMMQLDIERLLKLFPPQLDDPIERSEFNRLSGETYDRLRDFQILHYKLAGTPMSMSVPESVQFKYDLFKARGRMAILDEDHLFRDQWVSLFLGHGIIPKRVDPMVIGINPDDVDDKIKGLETIIGQATAQMPSHVDFIKRHCAAEGFAYD